MPNGVVLASAAATFVIFGISLASIYLYIFNRGTRQALHDLLVESYVVRTQPQGEVVGRVWPVHVMIAVAMLAVGVALPGVALPYVTQIADNEPFPQLNNLQAVLLADPAVESVSVSTDVTTFASMNEGTSQTSYLTVTVRLVKRYDDLNPIINRIARKVLQVDPKILGQQKLRIFVSVGFDLGIAQYEVKESDVATPEEWRKKLGPMPETI